MANRLAAVVAALTILIALAASACTPAQSPEPGPAAKKEAPGKRSTGTWEARWAETTAGAAKDGAVVIYTSAGNALRDPLTRAFREKFGISLDWVAGTTPELAEKVFREHRAGVYVADVYLSGVSAITLLGQGQKVLQSLDPVLFLPEVVDKKSWWNNELIFIDKEHTWTGFLAFPQPPILVNTDMVRPGEVKGWGDLLQPKWKKKMVLYNPRGGAGLAWAYHISEVIMSRDYMQKFALQEPVIVNNARQQVEWLAQGKFPVAVAPRTENMQEFMKLGAPVAPVSPVEGVHLTSGAGGLGMFNKAPHPHAATLFLNWALTKEGQTLLSQLIGGQSAREDVPTDFLHPTMVRQKGGKYFNTITAEHNLKKQEFAKVAIEIFSPLMK